MDPRKFSTEKFFEEITPRLKDFGKYALAIQKSIYSFIKSDEKIDPASAIVTDADFMVQEGLLRVIYNLGYKKINVGVEENSPYPRLFNKRSKVRIEIDPIDGTSAYKKEIDNWCIVLSTYKEGFLDGTLVHTPWDGKIYCATRDVERAWFYGPKGNREELIISPYPKSKNIVLTHFLSKEKQKKLEDIGIDVSQVNEDGKFGRYPFIGLNGIYRGELDAWFKKDAPARDWGSMSLIVEKGGGLVTDYNGNGLDYQFFNRKDKTTEGCVPSIITSVDKDLHNNLVGILKE